MRNNQIKLATEEASMVLNKTTVLIVDDEKFNREILEKHLKKASYNTVIATNGHQALTILNSLNERGESNVDIVLLDRMMPQLDGMEVLKKIKNNPVLKNIPVIMQTAMTDKNDIIEGIEAGAYYYITKPFAADMLLSVVSSATRESIQRNSMQKQLKRQAAVRNLVQSEVFELKTLQEAREVAAYLAQYSKTPSRTIIGLTSLITNAIEHGNLEIGYDKKSELLINEMWNQEIEERMKLHEYKDKKVQVRFEKISMSGVREKIIVYIKDEGKGFNWRNYLDFDPSRITDPNGRGIAIANATMKNNLEFLGCGNEAVYTFEVVTEL